MSKLLKTIKYYWYKFVEIMYGMMLYDAVLMFRRQRADMEHLINRWRRRMLRERDLTELAND